MTSLSLFPSMAQLLLPLSFLLLLLPLFNPIRAQISSLSTSTYQFLVVTKDLESRQYLTEVYHGTPLLPTKVVIDLGGPFLWLDCAASGNIFSSSRVLIPSCSINCSKAMAMAQHVTDLQTKDCFSGKSCQLFAENRVTKVVTRGDLVQDFVAVQSGSRLVSPMKFLFSCAFPAVLHDLARGAQGVMGLGRTQISLPTQVSAELGSRRRFLTCLSSSNGVILPGDVPIDPQLSRSMMYTPLFTNPDQDYVINVKSIKINGKRLSLNSVPGIGMGTKISTIVPYTTMESSVYGTFIKAFAKAAAYANMSRVEPPVAPFGVCFSAKTGVGVPAIELVLQSEMVKWRIDGRNSMVRVSDEVMCLGVLEMDGGGLDLDMMKTWIVLGGYQLEDMLFDFDLGASLLGFSSSTSCTNLLSQITLRHPF